MLAAAGTGKAAVCRRHARGDAAEAARELSNMLRGVKVVDIYMDIMGVNKTLTVN